MGGMLSSGASGKWLDADAVARLSGGRADAIARLSEIFLRTLPAQIERVRLASSAGDLVGLAAAVHMLYGTVSAFSTRVGDHTTSLEEAATRGDRDACAAFVGDLELMCIELADEVRMSISR